MTTILKEMGVQQWRLRRPHNSATATLNIDQGANVEHSERSIAPTSQLDTPAVPSGYVAEPEVGHIGIDLAADTALAENARGSESKPSIKPSAKPSAKASVKPMPVTGSESAKMVTPMPAPAPAPLPIARPSVAAMPLPAAINAQAENVSEASTLNSATVDPEQNSAPQHPMAALDWQGLQRLIDDQSQCQSCGSANSILGSGDPKADWMFVTDAPTSMDLESQQMFSGRAGQLYEAMLLAVGLTRDSVYTTSVFKCATSDDISIIPSCEKLLQRQIELVQPKVVVAFGEFAAQSVVKSNEGLESLRSQELRCYQTKVRIVVSYSPWQLLDQPSLKAGAWQDLKKCLAIAH